MYRAVRCVRTPKGSVINLNRPQIHWSIIFMVMETTGMWGLTLIILKDIKCFQIWAYFEGIGINFNFENIQNKIFPLFILRTIQSMHTRPYIEQSINYIWTLFKNNFYISITEPSGVFAHLRVQCLISQPTKIVLN
jgi:hypothetical protein